MTELPKWMFDALMVSEGAEVDDPADPGGHTKYGISKRAYPHEDIASLTPERARVLYERDYWLDDKLFLLPPALAYCVFDTNVNSGEARSIKLLQRVLGLQEDGELGPVTAGRVAGRAERIGLDQLVKDYSAARAAFLVALDKPRFIKGWLSRVKRVQTEALAHVPPVR